MLAFTLSSLKDATSHLFAQPSFDDFDVLSVTIVSYITFSMDGHLNAAFFEDADTQPDKLCSWQRLRPVCFSIIKGKQLLFPFRSHSFLKKTRLLTFLMIQCLPIIRTLMALHFIFPIEITLFHYRLALYFLVFPLTVTVNDCGITTLLLGSSKSSLILRRLNRTVSTQF